MTKYFYLSQNSSSKLEFIIPINNKLIFKNFEYDNASIKFLYTVL